MDPRTLPASSGPKFCTKSRSECPEIFYGDPFGDDFVQIGVDEGSGPSSHVTVTALIVERINNVTKTCEQYSSGYSVSFAHSAAAGREEVRPALISVCVSGCSPLIFWKTDHAPMKAISKKHVKGVHTDPEPHRTQGDPN